MSKKEVCQVNLNLKTVNVELPSNLKGAEDSVKETEREGRAFLL